MLFARSPIVTYLEKMPLSITREMGAKLAECERAGIFPEHLGAGYPNPDTFDVLADREHAQEVFPWYWEEIVNPQRAALGRSPISYPDFMNGTEQYVGAEGPLAPRELFADVYGKDFGLEFRVDDEKDPLPLVPSLGGSGGIDLVCTVLANAAARQGKQVAYLVDDEPYPGFTVRAMRDPNARLYSAGWDEDGPIIAELQQAIRQARADGCLVSLYYTVPIGHNPKGRSMTPERMEQVHALLLEEGRLSDDGNPTGDTIFILEDHPYQYMQYGERIRPFLNIDQAKGTKIVMHIVTASKFHNPGKRIGFVYAPQIVQNSCGEEIRMAEALRAAVGSTYLMHSPEAMWSLIPLLHSKKADGSFAPTSIWDLSAPKRQVYQENRDIMLAGLDQYLSGEGFEWNRPNDGFFLNFTDTQSRLKFDKDFILRMLMKHHVVVLPMYPFTAPDVRERDPNAGMNRLRLSFAYTTGRGAERRSQMERAALRFAQSLREELRLPRLD